MQRVVKEEILDSLPEDHPEALRNRRDILKFNRLMGSFRLFRALLAKELRRGDRVLELGAGDGGLGMYLRANLPQGGEIQITGLDLWSRPGNWPADWPWIRRDLTEFDEFEAYDIVIGNLILHQFEDAELATVGRFMREGPRLFIANEPLRARRYFHLLRLSPLMGVGETALHDARVSVEAGFRDRELADLLGMDATRWSCSHRHGILGQYTMVARRAGEGEA